VVGRHRADPLGLHREGTPRCIEHDIKPALGTVRLDKLTARQLDGFYHDLLARAVALVRAAVHSVLHAALDRAVKWAWSR